MKPFDYAIAENRAGALAALQQGYRVLAGGVDLADLLKEGVEPHDRLVSIDALDDLRAIERTEDGGLRLGALATLAGIAAFPDLPRLFPALAEAASNTASPEVRARATLAGNLLQRPRCWYYRSADFPCLKKGGSQCYAWAGENAPHSIFPSGACRIVHPSSLAPVLVAAGAEIVTDGPDGERRYRAGEFFVNTDRDPINETVLPQNELVVRVDLDELPARSAYIELKERQVYDWPLASCAAAWDGSKWHIVLGHVAPLPWRAVAAEELLQGHADLDEALAERAAEAAVSDAQPMSQNAFRVRWARAAVRRALLKACGKEPV